MRLIIEIIAAALLVFCISATSAAFAAGQDRPQRRRPELRVQRPGQRLARGALRGDPKRQCGGKFAANYCGDKLLSAM